MPEICFGGEFGEIRVGHRMALEAHETGCFHFRDLIPCQVTGIRIRKVIDEEDGRLESIFLQDGIGVLVVVLISVVERYNDGFFR